MYGDGITDLPARLLREGHYLRVTRPRQHTGERVAREEGFARVERVEAIDESGRVLAGRDDTDRAALLLAVFCRGVPGPLLPDTLQVLGRIDPARLDHDLRTPTWSHLPPSPIIPGARLLTGAPEEPPVPEDLAPMPPGAGRSAAFFPKVAGLLRAGEYIRLLSERYPPESTGIDEGFGRIEAVERLDGPSALEIGAVTSVILTVGGLLGVLVVRADQMLEVLTCPHLERQIMEERYPWRREPYLPIRGARPVTDLPDYADYPPAPADEQTAYPSSFRSPRDRELTLYGRHTIRAVPLAALPWPGRLHKCPHEPRFAGVLTQYLSTDTGSEPASAELFLQLTAKDFAACRYHAPDWPTIAQVARELVEAWPGDHRIAASLIGEDPRIAPDDRSWAESLFADPLLWDDGSDSMSGGRHRLCGMRAAGVTSCPVEGLNLARTLHPPALAAPVHARRAVAGYWAASLPGPRRIAAAAGHLMARQPALRRIVKALR